MKKYALIASLTLNAVFIVIIIMLNQSNILNSKNALFIDKSRLTDIKILESFLIGALSKQRATAVLESKFSSDLYFDKPSENGIGAGSMFLVFDDKGLLLEVQASPFEGP